MKLAFFICTNPAPHLYIVCYRPEMIKKMLDKMLSGDHVESSIVGGISVLLTLLEPPPK